MYIILKIMGNKSAILRVFGMAAKLIAEPHLQVVLFNSQGLAMHANAQLIASMWLASMRDSHWAHLVRKVSKSIVFLQICGKRELSALFR